MRRVITSVVILLATIANAQRSSDMAAVAILEKAATKIAKQQYNINIRLITKEPEKEKTSQTDIRLKLAGNKFNMKTKDFEIIFNGKTQWTYYPEVNEVTITNPTSKELQEISPFEIIKAYRKSYVVMFETQANTKTAKAITLLPNDKKNEIFRIRILVNKMNSSIEEIETSTREGQKITFKVGEYEKTDIKADTFIFDTKKISKISINDMR